VYLEIREMIRYVIQLGQFQEDIENREKIMSGPQPGEALQVRPGDVHSDLVGESTPGSIAA
jgi:hypothetical protein